MFFILATLLLLLPAIANPNALIPLGAAAQSRDDEAASGKAGDAAPAASEHLPSSRRPRPAPASRAAAPPLGADLPATTTEPEAGNRDREPAPTADPGDGDPRRRGVGQDRDQDRNRDRDRDGNRNRDRGRDPLLEPPDRDAEPVSLRIWPMPQGDYEFTQSFGCVPQIGGWYGLTPGCPADTPGFHTGIDLAAPQGTRFYAAAPGWVIEAGLDRAVGLANSRILIQHDGRNADYATEYLHWNVSYVEPGDYVRAGQPIGEVGSVGYSTGPHLHFSVAHFASGERIDPLGWLPRAGANPSVYRGLAPGGRPLTIDGENRNLPDYADPKPPPVPDRQPVPASPDPDRDAGDRRVRANREVEDAQAAGEIGRAAEEPRRDATRDDESRRERDAGAEEPPAATETDDGQARDGRGRRADGDQPANRDEPPPTEKTPAEGAADGGGNGRDDRGGRDDGGGNDGGRDQPAEPAPEPVDTSPFVPDLSAIPAIAPVAESPPREDGNRDGGGKDGGGKVGDGKDEPRKDRDQPKG